MSVAALEIAPCSAERELVFTVVAVRCGGQWLFCRKHGRETWETAGGHIEAGESPHDGAVRELYEETGIRTDKLVEVLDYFAAKVDVPSPSSSWGRVFLCVTDSVPDAPPLGFEMAETRLFTQLPDKLTYGGIARVIFPDIVRFAESYIL